MSRLDHGDGRVHVNPAWARCYRHFFFGDTPRIRVASPCVGVDAPKRAAEELGFESWESDLIFDLRPELLNVLLRLHPGLQTNMHIGQFEGDILSFDYTSVAGVIDGVVSGPPCPPWSSIGLGGSEADVRSRV